MGSDDRRNEQIIQVIGCWSSPAELAEFAVLRHGFGNSDVGFGVIYPDDLGEAEPGVEEVSIPSDHVQIYGYWGEAFEFVIEEREYLAVLAKTLRMKSLAAEAAKVEQLIA